MNNKNINHSKAEQLKDNNANKKVLFFAYNSITTSKFFIFFFSIFIAFSILAGVFSTNENVDAYIAFTVITIILVIILELYIGVLLVKAKALSIYHLDPENKGIWILFLVGLFIGITAIAGAFMTISACKTIIQIHHDDDFEDDNENIEK